jgi:hypothetical protein
MPRVRLVYGRDTNGRYVHEVYVDDEIILDGTDDVVTTTRTLLNSLGIECDEQFVDGDYERNEEVD